ncbi:MAG: DUF937 domain-containing protein, partial [Arenibacterium sp.]
QGETATEYARNPIEAAAPQARAQGENFLAQIFGSNDAAPRIAESVAAQTGADQNQVNALLPALAAMIQGVMQQNAPDKEIEAARAGIVKVGDQAGAGIGDLLNAVQFGGGIGGLVGSLLGGAQPQAQQGGLGGLLSMLESEGKAAQKPDNPLNAILGQFLR